MKRKTAKSNNGPKRPLTGAQIVEGFQKKVCHEKGDTY